MTRRERLLSLCVGGTAAYILEFTLAHDGRPPFFFLAALVVAVAIPSKRR